MQPQQQPNFDFIMNPGKAPKKSPLPSGNSTLQRILFVGGILVVLLIVFIVVSNLLSAGDKAEKERLVTVAQQQTELIRVAALGQANSTSQATKNFATNTTLTLSSDQKTLLATLGANGVKLKPKDLGKSMNNKTDASLEAATAASNYDATFLAIMTEQLGTYQSTLAKAYDNSKSKAMQDTLRSSYANTALLAKQLTATTP